MDKSVSCRVKAVLEPSLSAKACGLVGRGVAEVKLNDDGEMIFVMSDGKEFNLGGIPAQSVGVASETKLGAIKVGKNLKINDGVLSVDTVIDILQDNTKPVTSGAVYTEVGNIEVLLKNI